jgi:hypothetical protein
MRFPNIRYGSQAELEYYAMGIPLKDLARRLRRTERTVHDWLTGQAKIPWWVPEILRLQRVEAELQLKRMMWMREYQVRAKLGVVKPDGVLQLAELRPKKKPEITDLRLDDFDAPPGRLTR